MEELLNMIEHFARANNLKIRVSPGELYDRIVFRNEEGAEYYYRLDNGYNASEFPKIVQAVNEYFGLLKPEVTVEGNSGNGPENGPDAQRVDICGLSKNEYIALELTKAWASTRTQGHMSEHDIVDTYDELLKILREREDARKTEEGKQ